MTEGAMDGDGAREVSQGIGGEGGHACAPPTTVLSARGLELTYGLTPALRGVDLDVRQGEVLAVTGPSGSGKSSLLLCLAGVLKPDMGTVRFGERVISAESEKVRSRLRREEFGVLFQFGQLVEELPAVENVALPLLLGRMRRAEALDRAQTWLHRFGVGDVADHRPGQMSGGQAQRVAVARAMVAEPAVLFADEPTGALDSIAAEEVLAALVEAARDHGTTVVLVTHEARVAAYCDRDVEVRDGRLAGGTVAAVGSPVAVRARS
ncbi:ABC transporter ATP-binding protein [Phycicoccus sp. Root563]|uniref:ABC transporter ATP-binding protein n=1 Tax=Phycicoccus sp. Root563 TaxID=1736562 RepID=UPI000A5D1127|nr:ABC transporter ATP-binding protein [Phycicoccus sp. Root563]